MRPPTRTVGPAAERSGWLLVLALAAGLWAVNAVWLARDTRPPVWDMAMHQSYALNYLPGWGTGAGHFWEWSGNYPPFVHLVIALAFLLFRPGPDAAALANVPATILLLWGVYALARELGGKTAAIWACLLTALVPYLMWMSRETILDYWLSAWFVVFLVALRRTQEFANRRASLWMGGALALGLLTKWLFAAFAFFPLALVSLRSRVWEDEARLRNLCDGILAAGGLASLWYLPNLPRLAHYFSSNMQIGAREGEPPVFSFQSLIYYLRLLVGYQLFVLLFTLLVLSVFFVWRKRLITDQRFMAVAILGGWASMTLLRTKDPRFTMPLLALLCIICGAWVASWPGNRKGIAARGVLVSALALQAYAVNFGVSWLPQEVVLARGYQGSLRWDWNLFMQHYFHILGPPRREDWQENRILRRMVEDAAGSASNLTLAVIPDLPHFNAASFLLAGRLEHLPLGVDHPQPAAQGIRSFQGFDYVVAADGDQGMAWTTAGNIDLNRMIAGRPDVFRLIGTYPLPNGETARLYYIRRTDVQSP